MKTTMPDKSRTQSFGRLANVPAESLVSNGKRNHLYRPYGVVKVVKLDESSSSSRASNQVSCPSS